MNWMQRITLGLAATLALASCGGGGDSDTAISAPSRAATAAAAMNSGAVGASRRHVLAAADGGSVDPVDAANQLLDFAEVYYPDYFPGHPVTGTALGYVYRHYESTGLYLGVRDGEVYVLGGVFGNEVVDVGPLTRFITPQPRVLSTACSTGSRYGSFATPLAAVGRNAAVTVAGCSTTIAAVQWRQTSGPVVALVADKTQTLSFDPPAPGSYAFEATVTDPAGAVSTVTATLQAAAAATSPVGVTVRASQSVRMGGKVSVRAWPTLPEGDSVKAVTWTQIEGPAVTLDTSTSRLVLFTAPQVTSDTIIRLRATLHTTNGQSASDEVLILVERYTQAADDDEYAMWAGEHVPRVYAYRANGPYRNLLRRCTYDPAMISWGPRYNLCTLGQLPFLAQETGGAIPTVEQVMSHVLVSHDWLGRNFEAFLRTHDTQGDFRRMLNSVTAIVLSTQVRPSYYYAGTGAIYLDGDSFWLTPEERDTMNESPDYRSDFGSELQFVTLWRYVQDNKSIFAYFDPRARVTRTLDDVRNEAGWLLYHELGHALDFTPPLNYGSLNRFGSAWDNISPRYANRQLTSDTVTASYPLTSFEMAALGDVLFRGAAATAAQRAYTPADVAGFFSVDLAIDDYNYSTPREDVAMTLEAVLMQHRLGIQRDYAIADPYASESSTSSSLIVRWGQRGRVGEPTIRPRARAIVGALTPWVDPGEVDQLPAPIAMRSGESWAGNLAQPAAIPRLARPLNARPTWLEMWELRKELQRMQHHRHAGAKRLPPLYALCGASSAPTPPRCAAAR